MVIMWDTRSLDYSLFRDNPKRPTLNPKQQGNPEGIQDCNEEPTGQAPSKHRWVASALVHNM